MVVLAFAGSGGMPDPAGVPLFKDSVVLVPTGDIGGKVHRGLRPGIEQPLYHFGNNRPPRQRRGARRDRFARTAERQCRPGSFGQHAFVRHTIGKIGETMAVRLPRLCPNGVLRRGDRQSPTNAHRPRTVSPPGRHRALGAPSGPEPPGDPPVRNGPGRRRSGRAVNRHPAPPTDGRHRFTPDGGERTAKRCPAVRRAGTVTILIYDLMKSSART